jgi:O-antigen/teichoic acid export membrane protein
MDDAVSPLSRSLIKDTWIYGFGTLLSRAVGIVLIPLYTRYLSVENYGALALLNIIVQNVAFICLLGVSTAAMRSYFDVGAEAAHRGQVYGTATLLLILFPPLVLLVLGPIAWLLTTRYVPSLPFFPFVFVVLLTGLFAPLIKLLVGLLRVQRKPVAFVTFNIAFVLVQTVAVILALTVLNAGLRGQVYAQLLANGVFAGVALLLLRRHAAPGLSWPLARRLLAYGLPLVPFFIFLWIYEASARFMLDHYVDLQSVGIFALAGQFSGLLLITATALDNAMLPHFLERAGEAGGGEALGTVVLNYLAFLGLLALPIIILASPAIQLLTTPAYHAASGYVAPLVLAAFLFAARTPVAWSMNHSRRSGLLSTVNGVAAGLLIGLLYLFLGPLKLGIPGVAYAMIASSAITILLGYAVAYQSFALEIPLKRLALICVVLLTGGRLIAWLRPDHPDLGIIALQTLVFIGVALATLRIAGIRNPLQWLGIRARRA